MTPPPYSPHNSYAEIESIRERYIETGNAASTAATTMDNPSGTDSYGPGGLNEPALMTPPPYSPHDSYAEIESIRDRYIETGNVASTAGNTQDNPSGTNSYADPESVRYYVNPSLRESTNENNMENNIQSETDDRQAQEGHQYEHLRRY